MSGYPVLLEGTRIDALVVGGGAIGWRKATALLDAGAHVRVVATRMGEALRAGSPSYERLSLVERPYASGDIGDALLVIAATNDRAVNARVAADARRAIRLVNVVDAPDEGHYVTVATHRADPLVIAVSTGGVPRAAARIRDAISSRFDTRYQTALDALVALRQRLLARDERRHWGAVETALVDEHFCAHVEDGTFGARLAAWEPGARSDPLDVAWP